MFKIVHPRDDVDDVYELLVAQGICHPRLLGIRARLIRRGRPQDEPIVPVNIDLDHPPFWALWFFGLLPNTAYDLEIRDLQDVLIGTALNLRVKDRPLAPQIMYPQNNTTHCSVVPYGVTDEDDSVALSYIKLCPDGNCDNGTDGSESFRFHGYWSVSFPSVDEDTYELKVGHNAGEVSTKTGLVVGDC